MEIGPWIRELRKEGGWELRSLAARANVDASTLSRIENEKTRPTLMSVTSLCEVLQVTPAELLKALGGDASALISAHLQNDGYGKFILTIDDVASYLNCWLNGHYAEQLLSLLLNMVSRALYRGGEAKALYTFSTDNIKLLYHPSPLHTFTIHYPPQINASAVLDILNSGGAISFADAGVFIRETRQVRQPTMSKVNNEGNISASVLSRIEGGSLTNVKFDDIMALERYLEARGTILALFWEVAKLQQQIEHVLLVRTPPTEPTEGYLTIVQLFMTVCRWLQAYKVDETSWLDDLRNDCKFEQSPIF